MWETSSFPYLTTRCRGAYPMAIVEMLTHLSAKSQFERRAKVLLRDARKRARHKPLTDAALPLPHPLDHEWRFTRLSAEWLLSRATEKLNRGTLLLVCTPTILRLLCRSPRPFRVVFASRPDDPVTITLRKLIEDVEFVDIRGDLKNIGAD